MIGCRYPAARAAAAVKKQNRKEYAALRLRKLAQGEYGLVRELYEEVFCEDEAAFVDYYFQWKTKDNVIYAAEDQQGIQAMLHLNPFWVYRCGTVERMHYIVAVATREAYRHQGLMRRLLAVAEKDMKAAGETFTFLMPAAEQIYHPFGYRYFAWQRSGVLCTNGSECGKQGEWLCRPVEKEEYQKLADFVNAQLSVQYDMFVWRDAAYYERLCKEQQCQGGNVMLLTCPDTLLLHGTSYKDKNVNGKPDSGFILGVFCLEWDEKETPVFREVILDHTRFEAGYEALLSYINTEAYERCKVEGCQRELPLQNEKIEPLLMGKILVEDTFREIPESDAVFINEVV